MTKKFVHVLLDKNEPDPASGLWIDPQAITSMEVIPTTNYTKAKPDGWYVRGVVPGQIFVIPRDSIGPDKTFFDTAEEALEFMRSWMKVAAGPGVAIGD